MTYKKREFYCETFSAYKKRVISDEINELFKGLAKDECIEDLKLESIQYSAVQECEGCIIIHAVVVMSWVEIESEAYKKYINDL